MPVGRPFQGAVQRLPWKVLAELRADGSVVRQIIGLLHGAPSWTAVALVIAAGAFALAKAIAVGIGKAVLGSVEEDVAQRIYARIRIVVPWLSGSPGVVNWERAEPVLRGMAEKIENALSEEQHYLGLKGKRLRILYGSAAGSPVGPSRRLVILGDAGSGKTIFLQDLSRGVIAKEVPCPDLDRHIASVCDELLDVDRKDGFFVVPVIFNLGSWREEHSIYDWMADELVKLRYIAVEDKDVARWLVEKSLILPLLDGYDEVGGTARASLVDALENEDDIPFVLTGRLDPRPNLKDVPVILLKPVARAAAEIRLGRARNNIHGIPEEIIGEFLKQPLMIEVIRKVCSGRDPLILAGMEFGSAAELERRVLEEFVPAVYRENPPGVPGGLARRMRPPCGLDRAKAGLRYLAGLSGGKGKDGQDEDRIAWWEIGESEAGPVRRALFSAIAGGVVAGLVHGVVAFGAVPVLGWPAWYSALMTLAYAASMAPALGLVHWVTARRRHQALEPSNVKISLIGQAGQYYRDSVSGDSTLKRVRDGAFIGGACGFIGILIFGSLSTIVNSLWYGLGRSMGMSNVNFLLLFAAGLAFFAGISIVLGATLAIVLAIMKPLEANAGTGPPALLAASRRTVLRGGAVVALISGTGIGGLFGAFEGSALPIVVVFTGFIGGITVAFGGALSVTAWGQWIVFCRVWLPLRGKLPWRTAAFLEDARRRGVLRQNGGYYQFRHEHLKKCILSSDSFGR